MAGRDFVMGELYWLNVGVKKLQAPSTKGNGL